MKSILSFQPVFVHVIWGGDRIAKFKGIPPQGDDVGESWELSPMPGRESVVDSGEYRGRTLNSLVNDYGGDILGSRLLRRYGGRFPLLIKFIDSRRDLSVQVHPDDEMAAKLEEKRGKSEMWYSIAPAEGAYLYAGFKEKETPESLRKKIEDSEIVDALCKYYTKEGDVFYLPSGCVHAIGQGNFVTEIQEASDVTYRIFDYNRLGADGKPRELHVDKAIQAVKLDKSELSRPRNVQAVKNEAVPLVNCEFFHTDILEIDGELSLSLKPRDSFTILISVAGEVSVEGMEGDIMTISRGRTLLLPHSLEYVRITGAGRLISVYIP